MGAASTGAWTLLGGSQPAEAAPPPPKWDMEVDVLVAGAGVSGCSAAIAASDAGVPNVLLVEKTTRAGGSGWFSSGTILAAGTSMQKERKIQDSTALWLREAMETSEGGVEPEIARRLIEGSTEAFDFLHAAGMRWSFIDPLPGYSVPRGYREAGGGAKMMKVLTAEVQKRSGIKLVLETRVVRLYMDQWGRSGSEVVGAECMDAKGRATNVKARRAIVLCTGDYSANPAYIESHFPALKSTKFVGNAGNTGDGIRMAQKLGADITGYNPQGHPHCVEVEPGRALLWCRYEFLAQSGAILVNGAGKRFCDEPVKGYYVPLFPEVQKQNGHYSCVFDAAAAQRIAADSRFETTFRGHTEMFIKGLNGDGYVVKKADSIEELARKLGIDASGLAQTLTAYTAAVAAGKDAEFNRNPKFLLAMNTPPYYGWRGTIGVTTTRGGLRMDPEARILDPDRRPIPRLYGAGGTIGGYTNEAGYRSGWHLSNALAYGRIAGRNAAKEKPRA
ncbi:MAG: FAD-dependent oxidoreductase [Burkholderiales bacterium]|nr:FAD-dependent oxidoreductase [Burkholderiales bacterium]